MTNEYILQTKQFFDHQFMEWAGGGFTVTVSSTQKFDCARLTIKKTFSFRAALLRMCLTTDERVVTKSCENLHVL